MRNLIKKCLIMFIIGAASIISSEIISTAVGSTKAYASTENTKVPYLRDIYLSEDDSISFAKNQFKYVVDVDEDVDEDSKLDFLLPICNSPRMGVCGYEGSSVYPDQFEPDKE